MPAGITVAIAGMALALWLLSTSSLREARDTANATAVGVEHLLAEPKAMLATEARVLMPVNAARGNKCFPGHAESRHDSHFFAPLGREPDRRRCERRANRISIRPGKTVEPGGGILSFAKNRSEDKSAPWRMILPR
jgi:hypothetical protein